MFRDLKVSHKIWGLAGVLIAANIVVAGIILFQMNKIAGEIHDVSAEQLPLTQVVSKMTVHQLEQAILFERGMRMAEHIAADPGAAKKLTKLEERFTELGATIDKEIGQAKALVKTSLSHATGDAKTRYEQIMKGFAHYHEGHKVFETHVHEIFAAARAGTVDLDAMERAAHKIEEEEEALDKEIEGILDTISKFTQASLLTVEAHEKSALLLGSILTLVAVVLSLPLCLFIGRGISGPLHNVVEALGILS
ncbi:MAG: hypothetical protein D6773_19215, partial [Alphaproteobacteria bacterium]